ncbi:P-loop NTPase family protein [Pseudobutyrivibrio ruminis]|uniref:hypothetical protein n=1 Tax=Pseudobutyrivibrio ruminis TaxID=46206 RepID=UPI000BE3FDF3|nr:hypothetical protein [Pseudobutyrivibrio ruminis]
MNNNINGNTLKEQIRKWLSNVKLEEFCAEIESKVIGQKTINRILANIHSYLYCVAYNKPINHNMLLAAPSGTGKTETYRVIKAYFKNHIPLLPVNIFDVSQVTPTGYKGEDVKNILAPYF